MPRPRKPAVCLCGNLGQKRVGDGDWVCARCLKIEAWYYDHRQKGYERKIFLANLSQNEAYSGCSSDL